MMRLGVLATCSVLFLAGCAQQPSGGDRVRICDETGCSDRQKSQLSYESGDAVSEVDDARIASLKQIAETQPKAAYDLGLRYFRGDGVRQDSYQALVWMRKAAERGNLKAQSALGAFYLFGLEEMGPDPREAEKWLSLAADQGDQDSKKLLQQARDAKRADEDDWRSQGRDVYYGYWNAGYPYFGIWQRTGWVRY